MKATDEHGAKLFTIEHKPTLLNKADSNVVGRVANAILADADAPKVDDLKN
jgi:phage tail sheath protein FI